MSRTDARAADRGGLAPAYAAARARLLLVLILFALAAIGWWWTIDRSAGMAMGPWTGIGTLGWFLGVWVVMMAAMMFPSVAPTVALYSKMSRARLRPALFVAGYLITWTAAGALAFVIGLAGRAIVGDLTWERAGHLLTGVVLLVAAVYEVTPLKNVCLTRCRSPLGLLLGSWRDGPAGAVRMGIRNGAWCVGCCWALMAALFALGFMNPLWMVVVAVLIAVEKTLPWRRIATYGVTGVLLTLGILVLAVPDLMMPLIMPMQSSMR
jgi:predicted metal-binding membrane protein